LIAQDMAAKASVWFHGEGPDNALLFEGRAYLAWLRGRGDWRPYARAMAQLCPGPEHRRMAEICRKKRRLR